MLKKCLKYDLRSGALIWVIMAVCVIALSIPAGISFDRINLQTDPVIIQIVEMIFIIVEYIGIIGFMLVTQFLIYYRYYKNFFTDEGYLTFAIPIKRSTLLNSKIIGALIYQFATFLIIGIAGAVIASFQRGYEMEEIKQDLWAIVEDMGVWTGFLVLDIFLLTFMSVLLMTLFTYLCITVSCSIANRNKLIVTFCVWYGVCNFILPIVFTVIMFYVMSMMSLGMSAFPSLFSETPAPYICVLLLLFAIMILAINTLMYRIITEYLERKLNLS